MPIYRLFFCLFIIIASLSCWAKTTLPSPESLLAKSDALYISPAARQITDLAMDISLDTLQTDPVGKLAQIEYFYTGEHSQWVEVNQIPDEQNTLRQHILDEVTPIERFVMPTSSAESFAGMKLEIVPETHLLPGVSETTFYWIKGTAKDESTLKPGDVKIFRVLLDGQGKLYQMDVTNAKNERMTGAIDNIQLADSLHIATVKTRFIAASGDFIWLIENISYGPVAGVMLPVRVTIDYRDNNDRTAKGYQSSIVTFSNYRINKGIAAAELDKLSKMSSQTVIPPPIPPKPSIVQPTAPTLR
jgi:hypothetical protein